MGAGSSVVASSLVKCRFRFWALSRFPLVVVWSGVVALGGGVLSSPIPLCEQRPWRLVVAELGAGGVSFNKAAGLRILVALVGSAWLCFFFLFAAMEVGVGVGRRRQLADG